MPRKSFPPLYFVWQSMLRRCYTPTTKQFENYGGRGISVCDAWRNSYQAFEDDMSPRPDGHTLDRIDNDGDYTPDNCRWATRKQQQRNQTVTRRVVIEGKEYIAADLAEISGLKTDTIVERCRLGLPYDAVICPKKRVFRHGLSLGGAANGKRQQEKTHCKNGHEFTPENTSYSKQGWRRCRACKRDRQKEYLARKS